MGGRNQARGTINDRSVKKKVSAETGKMMKDKANARGGKQNKKPKELDSYGMKSTRVTMI